ncbi:MAG: cation diffusion facilitator family transporter, partial [Ferruginibacter sp.]
AFIIYKSVINFNGHSNLQKLDYALIIIGFTGVINWIAGTVCVRTGKKNNSLVLIASGKHLKSDTLTTLGIFVGLLLMLIFKYPWIDSSVAVIFASIIIFTGIKIIRSSVAGIMDETDILLLGKIVQTLNSQRKDNWMDIHNLRIIKYGATLHLDCHLTVPWYFNVNEAHTEVESLTTLMRENYGESVEMFIHSDGCLNSSCRICLKKDCPVRQHSLERKIDWTIKNISNNSKHNVDTK